MVKQFIGTVHQQNTDRIIYLHLSIKYRQNHFGKSKQNCDRSELHPTHFSTNNILICHRTVEKVFKICYPINNFFKMIFQASYQARLRSLIRFLNLRLNLIYFQLRDPRSLGNFLLGLITCSVPLLNSNPE